MAEGLRLGRVLFEFGLRETAKLIDEGVRRLREYTEAALADDGLGGEMGDSTGANGARAGNGRPAVRDAAPGRLVHLDVGPLANFEQLLGIQDAAAAIDGAEVGIERFSNRRAQLAVQVDDTVDLLRELEERTDLGFRVRARDRYDLVLDVE